jgi:hypothetical protein
MQRITEVDGESGPEDAEGGHMDQDEWDRRRIDDVVVRLVMMVVVSVRAVGVDVR